MDLQSADSSTYLMGAALVVAVLCGLVTAIAFALRGHFAEARATKLVTEARNLITLGIYARDEQGKPGPAELLGEAYRLQKQFGLKAETIGLRDDAEIDELINRAIRGDAPPAAKAASEVRNPVVYAFDDTGSMGHLPRIIHDKMPLVAGQLVENGYLEDPGVRTMAIGDTMPTEDVAETHAEILAAEDGTDEYLKNCADMAAGLEHRTGPDDVD